MKTGKKSRRLENRGKKRKRIEVAGNMGWVWGQGRTR